MPRALLYDGYGKPLQSVQVGDNHYLDIKNTALEDLLNGIDFAEENTLSNLSSSVDVDLSTRAAEATQEIILQYIEDAMAEILVNGSPEEVFQTSQIYTPGYIKGAEITVSEANPATITLDTNDKFLLEIDATLPDGEEITIPAGIYESGSDFVDAIITGLNNHTDPLEEYVTVEWDGNDDGQIRFTSNDTGVNSYVYLSEPTEHSALTEMGFDDFELVDEREGQGSLVDVIHQLEAVDINQISGEQRTQVDNKNAELLAAETLTWNGTDTEMETSDIAIPEGKEVLIRIDNGADKDLDVTFQHKIGTDYVYYYGADGELLTFNIPAIEDRVFGVINGWPRWDNGRITVAAQEAPTAEDETTIEVRES